MARTNLHELATRLLEGLSSASDEDRFVGKLRAVSADAGLNSVRSAEAIKLLEELGRIVVVQRGRRGRDTIIEIRSHDPVTLEDAEGKGPVRAAKRNGRLSYDDIGRQVVDRLLELSKDDALRAAQVEVFATQSDNYEKRIAELEEALETVGARETELRIKLRGAEEALRRAEENLQKAFGSRAPGQSEAVQDEDARAVLEILRSGRS
jgi:hypothetical protein